MSSTASSLRIVSVAAGPEQSAQAPAAAPAELGKLDVFIGRWINEGETVSEHGSPALRIVTSDIYEWAPGGHFMVHAAYGRIGAFDVGGVEIIDYDREAGSFRTRFFDSQGNANVAMLTERDGVWTWTGERTRCRADFSPDGTIQSAHHERSENGIVWVPSMEVVLRKVG
jgi:hypothetical protein